MYYLQNIHTYYTDKELVNKYVINSQNKRTPLCFNGEFVKKKLYHSSFRIFLKHAKFTSFYYGSTNMIYNFLNWDLRGL